MRYTMMKRLSQFLKRGLALNSWKTRSHGWARPLSTANTFEHLKAGVLEEYEVGKEVCGFRVREVQEVPELQLVALRLQHEKTGADYLHIAREDSNNVFCIGFRTTPMDSTGVPHILEHNVLCGSRKFPCRDPFFKMLNRSLSTFMNAMTGSDYTIYPFSTQNPVDYQNLMGVYLDAVFSPNLKEEDFLQEGWRLEHEDPSDKASPIIFKGVVFNEMKGVFADSHQLFMQKLQNGLLPSHTYGHVSGGEPLEIPNLTWENLRKFHRTHYHPSNARVFTYGNFPLRDHLSFIDSEYLAHYDRIQPNTEVPSEPRWKEPRQNHIGCAPDPMVPLESQTSLAVSYLLTDITDDFENFVLSLIGELLISGPNAPFYKTLIESQLGSSFSPVTGFDSHTRTTTFTVGLQGMNEEDVGRVAAVIEETWDAVVAEGFPPERVEAVLHSIELALKHQTSSFGLGLAMNLTPLWNHEGDPVRALRINEKTAKFRKLLKENPAFLQEKIKSYIRKNDHRFTLSMSPEEGFEERLAEAERKLLEARTKDLTNEDRERIWSLGHVLKKKQEEKEDISCLPTLHVRDIPRSVPPTPSSHLQVCSGTVPLQVCVQPTNGVSYFNAVLSTRGLDDELVPLLPLFCSILTSMGAGKLDFKAFNQEMELVSGGLRSSLHLARHPEDLRQFEEGIHLSSHSLHKNFESTLDLWTSILNEIRLDDLSRFSTLVKMIATEQANSLVHSGHSYAMTSAASSTNYVSYLKEEVGGLTQLQRLKEWSDSSDLGELLQKMKMISDRLLSKSNIRVAVNCSSEDSERDVASIEKFLGTLRGAPSNEGTLMAVPTTFAPCTRRTHHVFPFPVNFSAKSFSSISYTDPDCGPLRVLARLMFQFLHREIREKGGAYGGGAVSQPGGPFCFYSYRDPHSTRTLKTFDDAVEWVLEGNFTSQDVDEAKLGVFQSLDAPVSPGAKGMQLFLHHVTDSMFEAHRMSVLEAGAEDLVRACRKHLKEASLEGACLIGPQNDALSEEQSWQTVSH